MSCYFSLSLQSIFFFFLGSWTSSLNNESLGAVVVAIGCTQHFGWHTDRTTYFFDAGLYNQKKKHLKDQLSYDHKKCNKYRSICSQWYKCELDVMLILCIDLSKTNAYINILFFFVKVFVWYYQLILSWGQPKLHPYVPCP